MHRFRARQEGPAALALALALAAPACGAPPNATKPPTGPTPTSAADAGPLAVTDAGATAETPPGPRLPGALVSFPTGQEANALLGSSDGFTRQLSALDRALRMGTADPSTEADFLRHAGAQGLDWPEEERAQWSAAMEQLGRALEGLHLPLPPEVLLIRSTGKEELGAPHTRRNAIVLPEGDAARTAEQALGLAAHELFHIASRHAPERRDGLYALLGFQPFPGGSYPDSLESRRITNPDAYSLRHYLPVNVAGANTPVVPLILSRFALPEALPFKGFAQTLEVKLLGVSRDIGAQPGPPRVVPGAEQRLGGPQPQLFAMADTNWAALVAKNTGYAIHPEEVLADNFALLVRRRLGQKRDLPEPALLDALEAHLKATPRG